MNKSTDTVEFHWAGADGTCRNLGKFGLIANKPVLSFDYDVIAYVSNGIKSYTLGGMPYTLSRDQESELIAYAEDESHTDPFVPDMTQTDLYNHNASDESHDSLVNRIPSSCLVTDIDHLHPTCIRYTTRAGPKHPAGDVPGWLQYYSIHAVNVGVAVVRQFFFPLHDAVTMYGRTYEREEWGEWSKIGHSLQRVGSIWTTGLDLSEQSSTFAIPWKYIISEEADCTLDSDDTIWRSPYLGSFKFKLRLGFSSLKLSGSNNMTVNFMVDNIVAESTPFVKDEQVESYDFSYTAEVPEGSRVKLIIITDGVVSGNLVPNRTIMSVSSAKSTVANRKVALVYDTLSAFIINRGTEVFVRPAASGQTRGRILSAQWGSSPKIIKEVK